MKYPKEIIAARINFLTAALQIRNVGMQIKNMTRQAMGQSLAYNEDHFSDLLEEYQGKVEETLDELDLRDCPAIEILAPDPRIFDHPQPEAAPHASQVYGPCLTSINDTVMQLDDMSAFINLGERVGPRLFDFIGISGWAVHMTPSDECPLAEIAHIWNDQITHVLRPGRWILKREGKLIIPSEFSSSGVALLERLDARWEKRTYRLQGTRRFDDNDAMHYYRDDDFEAMRIAAHSEIVDLVRRFILDRAGSETLSITTTRLPAGKVVRLRDDNYLKLLEHGQWIVRTAKQWWIAPEQLEKALEATTFGKAT